MKTIRQTLTTSRPRCSLVEKVVQVCQTQVNFSLLSDFSCDLLLANLPFLLDNDLKLLFHHSLQLDLQRDVACWDVCEKQSGERKEEGMKGRGGSIEEGRRRHNSSASAW